MLSVGIIILTPPHATVATTVLRGFTAEVKSKKVYAKRAQ